MAHILQKAYSNAYSWMKTFEVKEDFIEIYMSKYILSESKSALVEVMG